ncbi:MAG: hypothetical protein JNJ46_17235 [Myxococcales bacterium]|nr:hypothetical protein [Myxococcales bacterium]
MDKLVTIGRESDGTPRQVAARELAGHLHGHPRWMYPHQLKEKYQISDEFWLTVRQDIAAEYREVYRNSRKGHDELPYLQINQSLAQYALALPHGASGMNLRVIEEHLRSSQIRELENYLFRIVLDPRYRARLLLKRYNKVPLFQEFAYLIEAAYFACLRDNYAAAFMTILPVIEGIMLRWANRPRHQKKMTFMEISKFVRDTPVRNPLLSTPFFADCWAKTCSAIIEDHLYKSTSTGPSFSNFNRHLALHVLETKDFCTPQNIMRAFLLLDLLGDLYLSENNKYDGIDTNPDEAVLPYLNPYLEIIKNRAANQEHAMVRYSQYKLLWDAHEQIGNPIEYWKNPLMLPFHEVIKRALLFASEKR